MNQRYRHVLDQTPRASVQKKKKDAESLTLMSDFF
jgi:hypothetical protein